MIPGLALKATAAALALSLAALGAQSWRLRGAHLELADQARAHAEQMARLNAAAVDAEQLARSEESRRVQAIAEVVHQQAQRAARAEADAARAAVAARGLRERAAALAAGGGAAPSDSAASAECAPARAAGDLLADVLGRLDETAGELAAALDAAHGAGISCERAFDALTQAPR